MISHEMRTPLNAIVGMSDLLVSKNLVDKEQKNYLETIKESADNLVSLTNNILDFSKIKANEWILRLPILASTKLSKVA